MTVRDFHYYEPAKGHGLSHNPLNALVAPRPIGWISSRDAQGRVNLAPYSFFNAFNYDPPIIGFSSIAWKDSVQNASETREFTWNLVTRELGDQMNQTSAPLAHGDDEFPFAGLTAVPGRAVKAPLIDECHASFECRLVDTSLIRRYSFFLFEVVKAHVATAPRYPTTVHYRGDGVFMISGRNVSYRRRFKWANL